MIDIEVRALLLTLSILSTLALAAIPTVSGSEAPRPDPRDVDITIDTVPIGREVIVDLILYTAPVTFTCASGTTRNVLVPSPQDESGTRYVFRAWSDGGTDEALPIDCDAASNLTAQFDTYYETVVRSEPTARTVVINGTPDVTPVIAWCLAGSGLDVSVPSPQDELGTRHTFTNWSDGGGANRTVACDGPIDLRANFLTEFLIGVFTVPDGLPVTVDGEASVSPAAFWCAAGSEAVVRVLPRFDTEDSSFAFDSWSDGGRDPTTIVQCDRPSNLTAFYTRVSGPLTPGPPPTLPIIGLLVAAVTIAIGVVLAVAGRRSHGPAPMSSPRLCAACRATAGPDWLYCSVCGADLPPRFSGIEHEARQPPEHRPPERT